MLTLWILVATLVAVGALSVAVLALKTSNRLQVRHDTLEAGLAELRREVERVASMSVHTGQRVQRVEDGYSDVAERVDVVETRGTAPSGAGPLDQAIELARQGVDADELTAQLGLSRGEAELIARMHGHKKRA